jgi:hypothetical protein
VVENNGKPVSEGFVDLDARATAETNQNNDHVPLGQLRLDGRHRPDHSGCWPDRTVTPPTIRARSIWLVEVCSFVGTD